MSKEKDELKKILDSTLKFNIIMYKIIGITFIVFCIAMGIIVKNIWSPIISIIFTLLLYKLGIDTQKKKHIRIAEYMDKNNDEEAIEYFFENEGWK